MHPLVPTARRAALLYGLVSASAPFAYLYVPDRLLVPNDALATFARVRDAEPLLRAAVFTELYGATLLIFAALALHRLFRGVDERIANVMAAMMLVSVPISYVNALHHVAPLVLVRNPAIGDVLGPNASAALVTLFLRLHAYGLVVNQVFWGLWLFPIGILAMRSGLVPRWLGIPLFLAGAGYVLNSLGTLLLPPSLRWTTDSLQALGIGELPFFTFYLKIRGLRGTPVDRPAALLVLAAFAIGSAALVALLLHRIDVPTYLALSGVYLALVAGLVLRWRRIEARDAAPAT